MIFDPPIWPIRDFDKAHGTNHVLRHKLKGLGLAPRTILIGNKEYVTREASVEFRAKLEQYAAEHDGRIEL